MESIVKNISSPDAQRLLKAITNIDLNVAAFLGEDGYAHILMLDIANPSCAKVGSKSSNSYVRKKFAQGGRLLKGRELDDINESLKAAAQYNETKVAVYYRVAPIPNGIEIDLGDESHRRIAVTPNSVAFVKSGSQSVFIRTPHMGSISLPADLSAGIVARLDNYLNMSSESKVLTLAWLTFTMAHPKVESSKFPILVLSGSQGTGKSVMSKLLLKFADPGSIGVRTFPNNLKDLAIASQSSHVLAYDNLRYLSPAMADALCIISTGGTVTVRELYTDSDVMSIRLHCAVILNGLHPFVNQSDLAQRCLMIELMPISKQARQTDAELQAKLDRDFADIYFGLLDLVSKIFAVLPNIKLKSAERMAEFSKWLAAMEVVYEVPTGTYQDYYATQIIEGQLDSLQDNLFASELLMFAQHRKQNDPWIGTPTKLLSELTDRALHGISRSRDWPDNAIALSKRIKPLIAPFEAQGVRLEFKRGSERKIIITNIGREVKVH